MRWLLVAALVAAVVVAIPQRGARAYENGQELHADCYSESAAGVGSCLGHIASVAAIILGRASACLMASTRVWSLSWR